MNPTRSLQSLLLTLTTDVLKEALALHPKPEIFNTDQGSRYTAKEHIEILKKIITFPSLWMPKVEV